MSKKEEYHRADEKEALDDRGHRAKPLPNQKSPGELFDKGVQDRIINSLYWKESCFGLNEETICDRAANLRYIGGTYGDNPIPTPFLCLVFKMLLLAPEKDIILEYLNFNDDSTNQFSEFKYLRCLAAFYIRLAWEPVDIYRTLEPLFTDYRRIRRRRKDGFTLTYVDKFIDELLTKDIVCGVTLWRLRSREELEDLDLLEPREPLLSDEEEDEQDMIDSGADISDLRVQDDALD